VKLVKPRKASESMMRNVNTTNHCRENEVIRIWAGLGGRRRRAHWSEAQREVVLWYLDVVGTH
jgi:hypothetical protein